MIITLIITNSVDFQLMRTGFVNGISDGLGRTLAMMILLLTVALFMPLKLVLVIKECNVLYHITTTTVPEVFDNVSGDRLNDAFGNWNNLAFSDKLPPGFTYLTCSCTF